SCDNRRLIIACGTRHLRSSSWASVNSPWTNPASGAALILRGLCACRCSARKLGGGPQPNYQQGKSQYREEEETHARVAVLLVPHFPLALQNGGKKAILEG